MDREPHSSFAHSPDLPGQIYEAFMERARRARLPGNVAVLETRRQREEWHQALAALEQYERS